MRVRSLRSLLLAAAPLLLAGCHGSSPTEPAGASRPLPVNFSVTGSADSISSDGTTVSCLLELFFELTDPPRQLPGMLEYDAVHGGAIRRTVLDAVMRGHFFAMADDKPRPETTPRLVNLVSAHVKKVSRRAQIDIIIKRKGRELPILPDIQQAIFYVVREALSNVEKHSRAKKAKVLIAWGEDCLTITISDNGIGFNCQNVDGAKHFGMEIMQDRVKKINGSINIQSSEHTGTEVTFSVPVVVPNKEEI